MGLKEDLQNQVTELQAKIAILNGVPEDTFTFGTVMLFSGNSGQKWYYVKIGEEAWVNIKGGDQKDLPSWILFSLESNIGYFEVYQLSVAPIPFYASA